MTILLTMILISAAPLPDYPLAAPVQASIAQDALIIQATQRWYLIDKGSVLSPAERLGQLLDTRPITQYDHVDGHLFVEILVSREGYRIIADGLASLLCTQITPAKEVPKNSYWYDRPVWQVQLEITTKWAKKWEPRTGKVIMQGVNSMHALLWSVWVKSRIGKPALSAHEPKLPSAADDIWGYRGLAGGNMGKAIVKATVIAHQQQILLLESQAKSLELNWRRRYSNLYIRWLNATAHEEWIDCRGRQATSQYESDAQYQHCREVMSDTAMIEQGLKEHKATRTATYTLIRRKRQAVEFHKRGLAEAKKVLAESKAEVKTK